MERSSRPPRPSRPIAAADSRADIVILGGGPAGAAASQLLARFGYRVVVLTRPPAGQALAESLPPSTARLLERIGVGRAVDAAGFIRSTGNTVWWGDAAEARVERFGGDALGWQVPRTTFDRLLLAEARSAGARVLRRATVRDVSLGGLDTARAVVHYDVGRRSRSIAARWILDCTGRSGLLARRGWRRPDPSGRTLAVAGVWERPGGWDMLADDTHTLVESYEGGWAWSIPVSAQRRYVTVMVDPALTQVGRRRGRSGLTTIYREELEKAGRLNALASTGARPARLTGRPFARDASSYSAARVAEYGVLLVGDASSFIDPLSSYGIKKALSSAWLASIVVHTALADSAMVHPALELYEQRERAMYDGLRRRFAELSRDAASSLETDFWRARATADAGENGEPDVAALRRDPEVLTAFDAIRERPSVALHPSASLGRVPRPTVRGDRVVLEEHLVVPAFPDGVRYIRSVDLVKLVEIAPAHDQVPDLYAAYNRAAPPAALPDFLGALSVLVGKRMLDLA